MRENLVELLVAMLHSLSYPVKQAHRMQITRQGYRALRLRSTGAFEADSFASYLDDLAVGF
jgi:hypothetical protein